MIIHKDSHRPAAQSDPDSQTLRLWLVIAHQVIVQSGFFIEVLVLQSERLLGVLVNPLVLFQTTSIPSLRSSEKRKLRACVPFALYIGTVGFIGYSLLIYKDCIISIYLSDFSSQKMYK